MRVYLDGKQVGSLERSGKLTTQEGTVAFIGSSNGGGEHFQGCLDDLRIYNSALTAEQIKQLHQGGIQSMAKLAREFEEKVDGFCSPGKSFAETLVAMRKKLVEGRVRLDREFAGALLTRLRTTFPEDYERFTAWTNSGVIGYLTARDNDFNIREAERLVELALEYKPLTEQQKSKQTPDELRKWQRAEAIQKRLEDLNSLGETAQFSVEWIRIMLEAGLGVQFRPYQNEPVAPYVKPDTPPVRNLTADEAEETLRRDWLHQADRKVTPERIQSEIGWTRQLTVRISAGFPGRVDFAKELANLDKLAGQAESLEGDCENLYFEVRRVKRAIMFRNPVVDFDKVLLVDMPYPQGREWHHETRHRLGYMAVPGGRLMVLEGLSPDGKLRQLMPQAPLHGSFWRPDLSFDARKVVFCFKPHNEKAFHLYEINVDGSVAFHAPTGRPLHFQLLDADYRALQTMRSFTGVMPGERRGCLGCHELHSTTPQLDTKSIALLKPPCQITPPPWGEDTVSYVRYVQPLLDKYCGKCHQGDGEGRKTFDMTARPGFLIFNEPYVTLIGRPSWGRPYIKPEDPPPGFGIANMIMVEGYDQRDPVVYQTPEPMTHLSYKSKLVEIASSGKHNDVKVDPVDLRKLIAWIDTMCPYRGDKEVREIDDPVFQGVDWLSVRPKIKTAPRIIRPGPVD